MSDTDPFGRKPGEDSLKDMGWSLPAAGPAPAPTPAPAPAASSGVAPNAMLGASAPPIQPPPAFRPPSAGPVYTVRRSGLALRVLIPLVVFGVIAGVVVSAVDTASNAVHVHIPAISVPQFNVPSLTPSTTTKPSTPPRGLSAGSMFRPGAVSSAMARLRALGHPHLLRISAASIDATLQTSGGHQRLVILNFDGTRFQPTGGVASTADVYPYSSVDPAAPARLVRAAAKAAHRPTSAVDYLLLWRFAGNLQYNAYLKNGGPYYQADPHGRHLKKIG